MFAPGEVFGGQAASRWLINKAAELNTRMAIAALARAAEKPAIT